MVNLLEALIVNGLVRQTLVSTQEVMDHSVAAAWRHSSDEHICVVTSRIIQGAFYWATGQEADMDEVACKSTGAQACEFKIKLGGK